MQKKKFSMISAIGKEILFFDKIVTKLKKNYFSFCDALSEINIDKEELEELKRCLESAEDL